MINTNGKLIATFNGPIEIGLRALSILNEAFSTSYSLQRLVIFDYLIVHSDDCPGGPPSLHPKTPYRSGELLVRRGVLQEGLLLFQSRGLVEQIYSADGLRFSATERTASFLDALTSAYLLDLRARAVWIVDEFGDLSDSEIANFVESNLDKWGAEFTMEAVFRLGDTTWHYQASTLPD